MTWRDKIEIHEAANHFPMMSKDELKELATDIAENGLRVGIILWTPERPEDIRPRKGPQKLYLLDGRNRLEAIERAYSTSEADEAINAALDPESWPTPAKIVYGDEDPLTYVVSANIQRRHLTVEQKRDIIAELLKVTPDRSNLATAKIAGVSDKTVASVRRDLEGRSEIPNADTRIDAVGRQQPARKRRELETVTNNNVVNLPTDSIPSSEPRRTVNAREAKASDKRIDAFIRATKNLSDDEFLIAAMWFDEYREKCGGTVFDNTRSGKNFR